MVSSVLIIEDEREFAEFIISGLTEEGFSVQHAVDGDQGREMLRSQSWDLVLLDWSLPGQDGLSLLRGYRQSGGEAPVIFLTARDEVDDRVGASTAGPMIIFASPSRSPSCWPASAPWSVVASGHRA